MNNKILINEAFNDIKLDEENYEYKYLTSVTTSRLYKCKDEDKVLNAHLLHIISDLNDEGWYLVACKGEINEGVCGKFLFQKVRRKQ